MIKINSLVFFFFSVFPRTMVNVSTDLRSFFGRAILQSAKEEINNIPFLLFSLFRKSQLQN